MYIFVGYWIDNGGLSKLRSSLVVILFLLVFGLGFSMQLFAYSQPQDCVFNYSSPLLPISGAFLFELIRRCGHRFNAVSKPITYIAKISFGIYFMHIVIMTVLTSVTDTFDLSRPMRLMMYMAVSFAGSILIIMPLSRIKVFRKHLFMIK